MPQIRSESFAKVTTGNEAENEDDGEFVEYQSLLAHKIIEKTSLQSHISSGFPFETLNSNQEQDKYIKRRKYYIDKISSCLKIFIVCLVISLLIMLKKAIVRSWVDNVDDTSVVQYKKLLFLEDIDSWCLDNKKRCKCTNPLVPKDRNGHETWSTAHSFNIIQSREVANLLKKSNSLLDVMFLGDSITEGWMGRSLGVNNDKKKDNFPIFQEYFQSINSKRYGMALGIAGDKSPNLLWRIQNGEILLPELQPKVYWVLIGTNDFTAGPDFCSVEVIYMGIIRVIEELKEQITTKSTSTSPRPKIVIQALLPRADNLFDMASGNLYPPETSQVETNRYKAIVEINNKLHQYCLQPEHLGFVYYLNLNDIFIAKRNNPDHIVINENVAYSDYYIPKRLMDDFLHPTALGYKMWAQRIIRELDRII